MTSIQPKEIMLGQGSTCYNNPGNKAFRKVIKKHVIYYKNQASRKEKAALVKWLVSKLTAKGYRFLQQSTTGTYVEAPPRLAENKVAHSLRDARIEAAKIRCDSNVVPQDFLPDSTELKRRRQNKPDITWEEETKEEMICSQSDNTAVIIHGWVESRDINSSIQMHFQEVLFTDVHRSLPECKLW
ncbi:hypothetical protein MHU86_1971 [Fragilaria crotonensis]|nr:hypothetical protein MHU86_1971 [Fragilaria crotonensis]